MPSIARVEVTRYPEYLFLTEQEKDRFWRRVDLSTESYLDCWNWQGRTNQWGYGVFYLRGSYRYAHRIVGINLLGDAEQIRHLCNNKICQNPFHLALGTGFDNAADRKAAGAYLKRVAQVSNEERSFIFGLRADGKTQREIAEVTGRSYNTVRRVLRAAV